MKILLYITGSISCYKTYDLARNLINNGHQVKVTLSNGAEKFIRSELFRYLGAEAVYNSQDDFLSENKNVEMSSPVKHVELAQWADLFVIAPCSANTIGHLANGLTKDLGTTVFLALTKKVPTLIFPAMNTEMLNHCIYQKNIQELEKLEHVHLFPTQVGQLACGDFGAGKLLETRQMTNLIESFPSNGLISKKILITTGATISPLDDVRYLTNPSSGETGFQFAKDFLQKGWSVTVIAGKYSTEQLDDLTAHPHFKLHRKLTTEDFHHEVAEIFKFQDMYISAAAISDIQFSKSEGKLKKSNLQGSLNYDISTDILKEVIKEKKHNQKIIGFAAETNFSNNELQEKWRRKPVDLLIGTKVCNGSNDKQVEGFGDVQANYQLISEGKLMLSKILNKKELSQEVSKWTDLWFN